jgi:hypothetical protein
MFSVFKLTRSDRTTPIPTLIQTILILISASILIWFIYLSTAVRFTSFDDSPRINPLVPEKVLEFGQAPGIVKVGLYIQHFPEFDVLENNFTFTGIVSFEFDPSIISLDILQKFSFSKGDIVEKSEPVVRFLQGDRVFAQYDVKVEFKTNLNEEKFPFSDRSIYVMIVNRFVSPGEVAFEAMRSRFNVDPALHIPDWNYHDRSVQAGYLESKLDEFDTEKNVYRPVIVFKLDLMRAGIRQALLIILPLALIFYVTLFSLSYPGDSRAETKRLGLAVGGVTAILSYRFVIEQLSPQVGYFTVSDSIYFMFLGVMLAVLIVNLVRARINYTATLFTLLFLHIVVLSSITYLLQYWVI